MPPAMKEKAKSSRSRRESASSSRLFTEDFKALRSALPLVLALGPSFAFLGSAAAADWGYDEGQKAPEQIEQSAAGLAKSLLPAKQAKSVSKPNPQQSKVNSQQSKLSPQQTKLSQQQSKPGSPKTTPRPEAETANSAMQNGKATPPPSTGSVEVLQVTDSPLPERTFTKSAKTAIPGHGSGKGSSESPKSRVQPVSPGSSILDQALLSSGYASSSEQQTARCWLQLLQVSAKNPLEPAQQKRMESYIIARAKSKQDESARLQKILKFWPKLLEDLRVRPDMEPHYADLFRALLRLHERTSGAAKTLIENSPYSCDGDLITELLGLERIAVDDTPPFTEDAVNAYADMAVFIYEQQHAGRTIDASDNRALFAKVIAEKFRMAPTERDRRAMANFDLSWTKFKIIWFSSSESTRKLLLEKLVKTGADSSLTVAKDPLLDLVMSNWSWETSP